MKQQSYATYCQCPSCKKKTSRWLWNYSERQRVWLRRVIDTEQLPIIISHVFSEGQRSWEVHWLIWRKPSKSSTTTCITVSRALMSASRLVTHVIFTWIFVPFCHKWESMIWLSSIPWRHWFLFKMSLSPRFQLKMLTIKQMMATLNNRRDLRTAWSSSALHTIT